MQTISPLRRLIDRFESKTHLSFKPQATFYKEMGINRLRFAQLTKGQKTLDTTEVKSLAQYFGQYFTVKTDDLL